MDQTFIMIVIALLIILILVLFVFLMKNENRKSNDEIEMMRRQVTEDLLTFQTSLMNEIRNDMNMFNENTNNRLFKIEHNVNQQLNTGFESTNKVFKEVIEQVTKIDQTQEQLKKLGIDISSLHMILNDKKTRGIYGEIELYSLLESAYGDNIQRFAKQYKLSNGAIVDAVIFGNEVLGTIPIDSKFPLENFNRLQNAQISASQKTVLLNEFKSDVKKHIQAIANKYIIPNETSEFAYMFIPAEAIFSYINANLEEVLRFSYEKKVYIVSPTTLMAYITAIKALYLGQKKNEKIKQIQDELVKLSVEFERFAKRYENVQKDYEKSYRDMKDVLISANKIVAKFKKIEAAEIEDLQE